MALPVRPTPQTAAPNTPPATPEIKTTTPQILQECIIVQRCPSLSRYTPPITPQSSMESPRASPAAEIVVQPFRKELYKATLLECIKVEMPPEFWDVGDLN